MIWNEQNQSAGKISCGGLNRRAHRCPSPADMRQGRGKLWNGAGAVRRFDERFENVFASGRITGFLRRFLDALSGRIHGGSENGFLDVLAIMLLALTLVVLAEPIRLLIVYAGGGQ